MLTLTSQIDYSVYVAPRKVALRILNTRDPVPRLRYSGSSHFWSRLRL